MIFYLLSFSWRWLILIRCPNHFSTDCLQIHAENICLCLVFWNSCKFHGYSIIYSKGSNVLYLPLAMAHTHTHTRSSNLTQFSSASSLCVCVFDWFTLYEVVNVCLWPFCSVSFESSMALTCLTGTLLSSNNWLPVNHGHINNQQHTVLHLQHPFPFPLWK